MKIFISLLTCLLVFIGNTHSQNVLYTKDRNLPCVERKFWVYVHLVADSLGKVNISESKIQEHLEAANQAFAPICISFDYCKIDTVIDYSFLHINDEDEVELLVSRYQKKRRINLYYPESVFNPDLNSFSYYDGVNNIDEAVIIIPQSGLGLIHELGHTFGLYHIFETEFGYELVDGSNCEVSGDFLCDTPAASPSARPDMNCNYDYNIKDPNEDFYRTEIGNYMSHFFCAHCFFTTGQYERMANNYLNSTLKLW